MLPAGPSLAHLSIPSLTGSHLLLKNNDTLSPDASHAHDYSCHPSVRWHHPACQNGIKMPCSEKISRGAHQHPSWPQGGSLGTEDSACHFRPVPGSSPIQNFVPGRWCHLTRGHLAMWADVAMNIGLWVELGKEAPLHRTGLPRAIKRA